jgi:hypothetical protein
MEFIKWYIDFQLLSIPLSKSTRPCCVFPRLFPHRVQQRSNNMPVRSHSTFCQYLLDMSPLDEKFLVDNLPFVGRNKVIYRTVTTCNYQPRWRVPQIFQQSPQQNAGVVPWMTLGELSDSVPRSRRNSRRRRFYRTQQHHRYIKERKCCTIRTTIARYGWVHIKRIISVG